jgi:hypothetical protein
MPKPNSPISLNPCCLHLNTQSTSYICAVERLLDTKGRFSLLLQSTIDCSHKIQLQEVSQTSFGLVFTYPLDPCLWSFFQKRKFDCSFASLSCGPSCVTNLHTTSDVWKEHGFWFSMGNIIFILQMFF